MIKRWSLTFLVGFLLLIISNPVLGAINASPSSKIDLWYDITPEQPFAEVRLDGITLYRNDQTFFDFNRYIYVDDYYQSIHNINRFNASYLFDNGFFLQFFSLYDYDYCFVPGYCFNLKNHGYIAICVLYGSDGGNNPSISNYDLRYKYFGTNSKLNIEILQSNYGKLNFANLNLVKKITENLAIGFDCTIDDGYNYSSAGLSWGKATSSVLDFTIGNLADEDNQYLLLAYTFPVETGIRAGFTAVHGLMWVENSIGLNLKIDTNEKSGFLLKYNVNNKGYLHNLYNLSYQVDF